MTCAPCAANAWLSARPSPRAAPVIRTTCSDKSIISCLDIKKASLNETKDCWPDAPRQSEPADIAGEVRWACHPSDSMNGIRFDGCGLSPANTQDTPCLVC